MNCYEKALLELKESFDSYMSNIEAIIADTKSRCVRNVITKNNYYNHTPFYWEIICGKYSSKVLKEPVKSDDCYIYWFDSNDRIILVENYTFVTDSFRICELYLYNDAGADRLYFSSEIFSRLDRFDHPFGKTECCLTYTGRNGYQVSEYIYESDLLIKIINCYGNEFSDFKAMHYDFIYENSKLIQIIREHRSNGYKQICYTTKRPDFEGIRQYIYSNLSEMIRNEGEFSAIGIEGFIDQTLPEICVCFSRDEKPEESIADWKTDMKAIVFLDYQLTDTQEKKCVKLIAEILTRLAQEGSLKDKLIYFHQHQGPVSQYYSAARKVFKEAGIIVR